MLHGHGERMRNRCRTMNSFIDNPIRQHRLNSNGSSESSRTRSHSLCECYPKPRESRSGSDTHITMGCIHATESRSNLTMNKYGNFPIRPAIEAYDLMTLDRSNFNYNENCNNNFNQNQNNNGGGCRRAGRGYMGQKKNEILMIGDVDRRQPNRARRCPGMFDVRVSVLSV